MDSLCISNKSQLDTAFGNFSYLLIYREHINAEDK